MRTLHKVALTGIAVLTFAGVAMAAGRDEHEMSVLLPDGSIARIDYRGEVAPRFHVTPPVAIASMAFLDPLDDGPFVSLDRVAAELDQHSIALMQNVDAPLKRLPPLDTEGELAEFAKLPPDWVDHRLATTSNGNGSCFSWVQVVSSADNQPEIVTEREANCDVSNGGSGAGTAAIQSRQPFPVVPSGTAGVIRGRDLAKTV